MTGHTSSTSQPPSDAQRSARSERLVHRRRDRLRQELTDAGVRLPGDDRLAWDVLEEVDHARFPPVHEGSTPSYGAIVGSQQLRPDDFGGMLLQTDVGGPEVLRRLADGRQSFVLRRRQHFDLLLFDIAHDREAELIRLRAGAPAAVIVQRTPAGAVRILAPDGLFAWDGAHWWAKPYASTYTASVIEAVPDAPRAVLGAILDFCVHAMSPAAGGAVLIWRYSPRESGMFDGCNPAVPPVPVPLLALTEPATHAAVRQLLIQVDGASFVTAAGELLAVGAHLRASPRSHELVALDPARGTRHASARRFSFDHADSVVFVVSRDGPVTVYSDGAAVASIEQRPDGPVPADSRTQGRVHRVIQCPRCNKWVATSSHQPSTSAGPALGLRCPVCSAVLDENDDGVAHIVKKPPAAPTVDRHCDEPGAHGSGGHRNSE